MGTVSTTSAAQGAVRSGQQERGQGRAASRAGVKRVLLLGSTGSIGTQTLDVVAHLNDLHARGEWPERYEIVGLAAGSNAALVADQAKRFNVPHVALCNGAVDGAISANVTRGPEAALELVKRVECDVVLGAMVGSAGLPATLAAVEMGRDVALANKETLVAAGELVVPAAQQSGARLLPVDSEHCGVWQCLAGADVTTHCLERSSCPPLTTPACVSRVILTASGGAFRNRTKEETYHATPAEALKHPTWSMGPKVTIDSASLTNKALEVIEAHWLFGLPAEKIEAVIHPQSVVHSMVEFDDGSMIAQLALPDMRLPIQCALSYPHRPKGLTPRIDFAKMSKLEFMPPDHERFPALGLAYEVIRKGGTSGAVFNAANEAAVEAFLAGKIPFGRIPELSASAMKELGVSPVRSLGDVMEADRAARAYVSRVVNR